MAAAAAIAGNLANFFILSPLLYRYVRLKPVLSDVGVEWELWLGVQARGCKNLTKNPQPIEIMSYLFQFLLLDWCLSA